MSKLTCGAVGCAHNCESLCCKGEICVGGDHARNCADTCCENYAALRDGMAVRNSYTSSISHPSENVNIDCEVASCIYNEHYKCNAERVDISGRGGADKSTTSCQTFRRRKY